MGSIQTTKVNGHLVTASEHEELRAKPVINPFISPYYQDSTASSKAPDSLSGISAVTKSSSAAKATGWAFNDSIAAAPALDEMTKISKRSASGDSALDNVIFTNQALKSDDVLPLLENAYASISDKTKSEVDTSISKSSVQGNDLNRHMEALSNKINSALREEVRDFEKIHAMLLRFCMIHMRNVAKDDHEYLTKLGEQIKVQSGVIRDTYNTWPVVVITLVSSAVSVGGGVAGFSTLIRPGSEIAKTIASHAQQISGAATGISGVNSLLSSRSEGDRQILQLTLKRDQDKEEEKRGSKHGNKESQKLFRTAYDENLRNQRDTVSSILRG